VRLTILNQFYVPDISPTAHLAASLAEHRAARGDEVTVVASYGGYVEASNAAGTRAPQNPRVIRIWTPELGKARKLFRIADYAAFYLGAAFRLLTLPRQDVIISLTTPPFVAAAAVLHKLIHRRTRLVLWNMDCYPEVAERTGVLRENGWPSRMMRALNRWIFSGVDDLVSLDTAMQDLLLSQYSPRGRTLRARIIPNWERADFFPADAEPKPWEEADALGLRGRFVVLYLGNTGYGHRFDTVMQAAQLLRDEPVTFLFIGGGSRWAEIAEMAKKMGLGNVVMRGYVPKEQTPSVMKTAHCALITLQDFALGVMSPSKLHSNLAMGLPVAYVGPGGSNVDDAIRKFDCGVSVRHGQAHELAVWVRRMAALPPEYSVLRSRSRRAFDDAYCDSRTLPQFDAVLDPPQLPEAKASAYPATGRSDNSPSK
jgi:putative colanic acid biosynthesis glycosyltransferase WcaI